MKFHRSLYAMIALASPAFADEPIDCANAMNTVEITYCAGLSYEAADQALNMTYQNAMAAAKQMDAEGVFSAQPMATLLRDAQRAWIPFRDAACSAEAALAMGGTAANQYYLSCMERLTRARTEDLSFFAELN